MLVDEKGVHSDLKVVNSHGADMDKNILAAVSQYRSSQALWTTSPQRFR